MVAMIILDIVSILGIGGIIIFTTGVVTSRPVRILLDLLVGIVLLTSAYLLTHSAIAIAGLFP